MLSESRQKPVTHQLATCAMGLAVTLMIFPTMADFQFSAFAHRDIVRAALIEAIGLGIVFVPALIAERRIRRHPDRFKGRGLLMAVAIICALQFCMYSIVVVSIIFGW